MKKYIYIFILVVSIIGGMFVGFEISNKAEDAPVSKEVVVENKIGIVNQDVTQIYNDEKENFSTNLISNLMKIKKYEFEVVSDDKAQQGLDSNYYVASVTIPSDFTKNILSINEQVPNKVNLYYKINSNVSVSRQNEVAKDLEQMGYVVNNSLNYMYTYGIFEGVHKSQAYVDDVLSNNENSINYFEEIGSIDLLSLHEYDLKDKNEDKVEKLDVSETTQKAEEDLSVASEKTQEEIKAHNKEVKKVFGDQKKSLKDIRDYQEQKDDLFKEINDRLVVFTDKYKETPHTIKYGDNYNDMYSKFINDYNENKEFNELTKGVVSFQNKIKNIYIENEKISGEITKIELDKVQEPKFSFTPKYKSIKLNQKSKAYTKVVNKIKINKAYKQYLKEVNLCSNDQNCYATISQKPVDDYLTSLNNISKYVDNEITNVENLYDTNNSEVFVSAYDKESKQKNDVDKVYGNITTQIKENRSNFKNSVSKLNEDINSYTNNIKEYNKAIDDKNKENIKNQESLKKQNEDISKLFETDSVKKLMEFDKDLASFTDTYMLSDKELRGIKNIFFKPISKDFRFEYDLDNNVLKYDGQTVGDQISIEEIFGDYYTSDNIKVQNSIMLLEDINSRHTSDQRSLDNTLNTINTVINPDYLKESTGEFYNPDNPGSNKGKTEPYNIYAKYTGYEYCVGRFGNSYYPDEDDTCERHEFFGIEDKNETINTIIEDMLNDLNQPPAMDNVNFTVFTEILKDAEVDISEESKAWKDEAQKVVDKKVKVYTDNEEIITDYLDEISKDKTYDNTINKVTKSENTNNADSSKKLSYIDGVLPNTTVDGANNLSVYNFISNPVDVVDHSSGYKAQEIMTEIKENGLLKYIILAILLLLIIVGMLYILKKEKNSHE